ncbi:MAG TPA: response regulator transcription factor [Anaerohalosphaeraceae bacterium]|nr:response regulator transcription factor [Phycisphaerae bacterium]HOK96561.1 response regulator transcription factor [Anaerohalosphaeraceae bacterium]HOL31135.1 response regulator transcription factor [Anaerohalosphaeraceae bacterium]HOM76492.1 response regulator transcription factor [Anaerohalosphaeraceae bacterium]HPC64620.1 response regulator transcription factor [Anaerohalosphaeraceae bacterium]
MVVRVVLVDDHEIMREGMSALLRKYSQFEVVGQASDGRQAVEVVLELKPDIVIMDVGMPNLNGIEATRRMLAQLPNLKVMALSTHSDGNIVAKMIKAGACGYMLKDSAFEELIEGLNTILEGKTFLCNKVSKVVFSEYVSMITNPNRTLDDGLSSREREVLQMVAEGHTTKEIAEALNLSTKTVDSHREHIMEKLGIRNVAGLTRYAIREGLTTP